MLDYMLLVGLVLGQIVCPVLGGHKVSCTQVGFPINSSSGSSTTCSPISPNGCCAKGCVRNALGTCVKEQCTTGGWNGWMNRTVSISCYFHWFLLTFGAIIAALMVIVIILNLGYEVRLCLRKQRQKRYVRFSPRSSPSSSVV